MKTKYSIIPVHPPAQPAPPRLGELEPGSSFFFGGGLYTVLSRNYLDNTVHPNLVGSDRVIVFSHDDKCLSTFAPGHQVGDKTTPVDVTVTYQEKK